MLPGLRRIAAFTDDPAGGNPAGVFVGDVLPDPETMQAVAAEVGYSETAFAAPAAGPHRTVRYHSPLAEVPFCGHATIALGRVLGDAEGTGTYRLDTRAGEVALDVVVGAGRTTATLTSVEPSHVAAEAGLVDAVCDLLGWAPEDLDPRLPPAVASAGADHLVLASGSRDRLARLDYPFEALQAVMAGAALTTVALVWLEAPGIVHARNPFPVGGVVEDPATGAAAAALGGLLRARGLVDPPADLVVHQGVDMGRPSRLEVHVPVAGGIRVGGTAVDIPA
jgi:PhzF family phenazine biosynthesis protein